MLHQKAINSKEEGKWLLDRKHTLIMSEFVILFLYSEMSYEESDEEEYEESEEEEDDGDDQSSNPSSSRRGTRSSMKTQERN